MPDLTVTLIQTELDWEDVAANLRRFDRLIGSLQVATDLIVLPEMFTTGFSMNAAALAEDMNGRAVGWLRETARRTAAAVVGSIIVVDDGRFYNRLCWAGPNGEMATYDKKHLFRYAGEDQVYTAGSAFASGRVERLEGPALRLLRSTVSGLDTEHEPHLRSGAFCRQLAAAKSRALEAPAAGAGH